MSSITRASDNDFVELGPNMKLIRILSENRPPLGARFPLLTCVMDMQGIPLHKDDLNEIVVEIDKLGSEPITDELREILGRLRAFATGGKGEDLLPPAYE